MARFTLKLALVVVIMATGIFLGIQMTTNGIERINGPWATEMVAEQATVTKPTTVEESIVTPSADIGIDSDPSVESVQSGEVLPGKIGGLLQIMADHSIRFFVSILEKIFS